METPYKTLYHVFTDGQDAFYGEDDLNAASALFDKWASEDGNARLYREDYLTESDYDNDFAEELCLESAGMFPC